MEAKFIRVPPPPFFFPANHSSNNPSGWSGTYDQNPPRSQLASTLLKQYFIEISVKNCSRNKANPCSTPHSFQQNNTNQGQTSFREIYGLWRNFASHFALKICGLIHSAPFIIPPRSTSRTNLLWRQTTLSYPPLWSEFYCREAQLKLNLLWAFWIKLKSPHTVHSPRYRIIHKQMSFTCPPTSVAQHPNYTIPICGLVPIKALPSLRGLSVFQYSLLMQSPSPFPLLSNSKATFINNACYRLHRLRSESYLRLDPCRTRLGCCGTFTCSHLRKRWTKRGTDNQQTWRTPVASSETLRAMDIRCFQSVEVLAKKPNPSLRRRRGEEKAALELSRNPTT